MLPYLVILFIIILLCLGISLLLKRKWKYSLTSFLLLFLLNYITETFPINFIRCRGESPKFKVLCYNVHGSSNAYKDNQIGIASVIIEEAPDVAFLCEFNLSKSKKLDSLLIGGRKYNRYYKSGTNCVFYSKHSIDSIQPVYTDSIKSKRTLSNRVNLLLRNDTLTIIGCHLSSGRKQFMKSLKERRIEADSIYNCLKDVQNPVIVMGDMNDISGSYAINRIKEAGLKDAWWEGGCGYGTTYHDKWLRLRLDHILYQDSKLKLKNVRVIDSELSDHNALVAEFVFE